MIKHRSSRPAFTLIEMIAVIAIIALVTAWVVPSVATIFRASQLTQAATMLTDQINLARQQAVTKNCMVEVRFIRFADPEAPGETVTNPASGQYRAIQLMQILPSGVAVPLGKMVQFPSAAVLNCGASIAGQTGNPSLSSLLPSSSGSGQSANDYDLSQPVHGTPQSTDPDLPRDVKKNYDFYSFRFLPDGSTTLQPTGGWYVTVNLLTDLPKLISPTNLQNVNYYTLQIDATSGGTRSYRPTAS